MKLLKFESINTQPSVNEQRELEQKAEHIWSLMKAASDAGIKTYVCFGDLKMLN